MDASPTAAPQPAEGLTVVFGGARSGKSSFALRRALAYDGPVEFVATAPSGLDDDLDLRIDRHRAERPTEWHTTETPTEIVDALDATEQERPGALVVVDCLTLWVSNLMWAGRSDDEVIELASTTAERFAERRHPSIVISNEVGLGVHPESDLGRRYRDLLGWVNQRWAAAADRSVLLVAGQALVLTDPDLV